MIISMNDNGIDIETITKIADKDVLEVNNILASAKEE